MAPSWISPGKLGCDLVPRLCYVPFCLGALDSRVRSCWPFLPQWLPWAQVHVLAESLAEPLGHRVLSQPLAP